MPASLGQVGDLFKHRPARARDDVLAGFFQIGEGKLLHHLGKPAAADRVAHCQRVQVANDLIRLAHIGADNGHDCLGRLAAFKKRQDRNAQPFFKYLAGVRPKAPTANIHHMHR